MFRGENPALFWLGKVNGTEDEILVRHGPCRNVLIRKVSTTTEQERELKESGYKVVEGNVNEGTFGPPIHLW